MPRDKKTIIIILLCSIVVLTIAFIVVSKILNNRVTSTTSLLNKFDENLNKTYNFKVDSQFNINFSSEGQESNTPISLTGITKTNFVDISYSEFTTSINMDDSKIENIQKIYTNEEEGGLVQYIYDTNIGEWLRKETESKTISTSIYKDLPQRLLKIEDRLLFDKTDNGYQLVLDISDAGSTSLYEIIKSDNDIGFINNETSIKDGVVKFIFTKKCVLEEISIENITVNLKNSEDNYLSLGAGSASIIGKLTISDINEIDTLDMTVSDEIANNASDYDKKDKTKSKNNKATDAWGNIINNNDNAEDSDEDIETRGSDEESDNNEKYAYSFDLQINGHTFNTPFSYHSLQEIGWSVNFEDYGISDDYELGPYDRINSNIEAYHQDIDEPMIIGFENRTEFNEDITDANIWSIDITKNADNLPKINLKELNWKSTYDEIIETFGEADSVEEVETGYKVSYIKEDNNSIITMELYLDSDQVLYRIKEYRE